MAAPDANAVVTTRTEFKMLASVHVPDCPCGLNSWCQHPSLIHLILQVVEHVAGFLGLDASLVRERNFMYPKDLPAHPYALPILKSRVQAPKTASTFAKKDYQNCNGKAEHLDSHSTSNGSSVQPKGDSNLDDSSGKGHTNPDVVCGRFQLKDASSDGSQAVASSSGR